MTSRGKNIKFVKLRLNKRSVIIMALALILLLVITMLWVSSLINERQTLSELSSAGSDLETVYTEIIENHANISTGSSFRYECHESSTELGRGRIVCGPIGLIHFNQDATIEELKESIGSTIRKSGLFQSVSTGTISELGLSLSFKHDSTDCSLSGDSKAISIYCSKTVPDFLPGYTVEK